MRFESAVGGYDTNCDQRQQQAGRSVSRHYAFHQKHQFILVLVSESLPGIISAFSKAVNYPKGSKMNLSH